VAYVDYTTGIEDDVDNRLTVTTNKVSAFQVRQPDYAQVYWDDGADAIGLTLEWDCKLSLIALHNYYNDVAFFAVSNSIEDLYDWRANDSSAVFAAIQVYYLDTWSFRLEDTEANAVEIFEVGDGDPHTFYPKFTRPGDFDGGLWELDVYTDAEQTNIPPGGDLAIMGTMFQTYRYRFGFNAEGKPDGSSTHYATFDVENWDMNAGGPTTTSSTTSTTSSTTTSTTSTAAGAPHGPTVEVVKEAPVVSAVTEAPGLAAIVAPPAIQASRE